MYEENDGVIVESSATEEVIENNDAVNEEDSVPSEADSTPAPVEEKAVTEGEPAAPKKDAQARIRQLVERERVAREEAAYLRGQLEAKKEPVIEPKQETETQPIASQYDNYDDYVDARATWRARQEFARLESEREQKAKDRETKTREEQVETTFKDKVTEFKAKTPDFDDVMGNPSLRISKTMYEAMRESEAGAQIAYHLGKNPAEAARISALSPIAAIREIGKLEAKLTSTPPPAQTTKPSNAPAPPAVVDGKAGGAAKSPDQMTDDEWYASWKKDQMAKAQARRK